MAIDKIDFHGDPNIGFYGTVTSQFALLAEGLEYDFFGVNRVSTRIGGVRLAGLFSAGNVNSLLVPNILREREKRNLKEANIPFDELKSNYNALGNLILCNDNGALISKNLKEHRSEIRKILEVPVKIGSIAGLDIPGSCGFATNKGAILHREATKEEIEVVEDALEVEAGTGSVNFGSPYVGSGILANQNEVLMGNNTTGPETVRIQNSLKIFE